MFCSGDNCREEKDNTVGTSTDSSTIGGMRESRSTSRCWLLSSRILGVDNLLDVGLHVQEPAEIDQLFSHLRHKHIENRNGWPTPAGLVVKDIEELRLGGEVLQDHGSDVQLIPLSRSWPSSVPLGLLGVESRPGAWRRLAVRAEPSLLLPLGGPQHNVPTTSIQQKSHS